MKSGTRTCECGAPTDAPCGVCDECIHRDAVESAARQGLPATVEDPHALRELSRIVHADMPPERS